MRIAIVEVMGSLIRELALSADLTADAQTTQKQIRGLYDLLLERTLDLSSYVRARVLQVLSRLLDLPVKFPKERLATTRAAISALEDKAATVRKNAIVLIVRLITTHPYGLMHGGLLGLSEWQERYEQILEELGKVEAKVGKVVERVEGEDEEEDEEEGNSEEKDEDEEEGEDEDAEGEQGAESRKLNKKKRRAISLYSSINANSPWTQRPRGWDGR
jgi:condensin complex subunit 1